MEKKKRKKENKKQNRKPNQKSKTKPPLRRKAERDGSACSGPAGAAGRTWKRKPPWGTARAPRRTPWSCQWWRGGGEPRAPRAASANSPLKNRFVAAWLLCAAGDEWGRGGRLPGAGGVRTAGAEERRGRRWDGARTRCSSCGAGSPRRRQSEGASFCRPGWKENNRDSPDLSRSPREQSVSHCALGLFFQGLSNF